ncbi:MAG: hypothetical protein WC942_02455 [Clostridia bacterium]
MNQGKNTLLNVMFHGVAASHPWYIGLIDANGYASLAATDTYQGINDGNGWSEFEDYGTGNREEFEEEAAASQALSNSATPAYINITASGTVKGAFLVGYGANADVVGDNDVDGILFCTALFSVGDVEVANEDQLKIVYTLTA